MAFKMKGAQYPKSALKHSNKKDKDCNPVYHTNRDWNLENDTHVHASATSPERIETVRKDGSGGGKNPKKK